MVNPLAAFLVAATAFSSGLSSDAPDALAPLNPHITVTRPAGAQRVAAPERVTAILKGTNVTPNGAVRMTVAPNGSTVNGFDGCNGFTGRLVVGGQGSLQLVDVVNNAPDCSSHPEAGEFWNVMGKPSVMFVGANNRIYLTTGYSTIAFDKVNG